MTANKSKNNHWRSLDELAETPAFQEFVKHEFPNGAFQELNGTSRRKFLQLMGASFGLAGMTGCLWPREEIVPYSKRPEHLVPGNSRQYATAMELNGVASGLLVTSNDGRPTKIEGNPKHPTSHGGTNAFAQASVLELYDPDRLKNPIQKQTNEETGEINQTDASWDEFASYLDELKETLTQSKGEGFCVLAEATSSPSLLRYQKKLLETYPNAKWLTYEPIHNDFEKQATQNLFGQPQRIHCNLKNANIIVSLDSDFLVAHPDAQRLSFDFTEGRKDPHHGMNRLYVFESRYSTTGSMADHRIPLPSSHIEYLAACLAARLMDKLGSKLPQKFRPVKQKFLGLADTEYQKEYLDAITDDLLANQGKSLILCGQNQPALAHEITCLLNEILKNNGRAVRYSTFENGEAGNAFYLEDIQTLAADAKNGSLKTLFILGGNPLYNAPSDVTFTDILDQVETIHLTLYKNQTSQQSKWMLPRSHYLESWDDVRGYDGSVSIVQPLISPLYNTKTPIEIFSTLLDKEPKSAYDLLREEYKPFSHNAKEWRRVLYQGFMNSGSEYTAFANAVNETALLDTLQTASPTKPSQKNNLEITFFADSKVYDGRYANNAWLQELPDPQTKITWDNAALIGPNTAAQYKIQTGDLIEIGDPNTPDRKLTIAAFVQPGQADGTLALPLGYGQTAENLSVGKNVGFNTYTLRATDASYIRAGLQLNNTRKQYTLACTQDHHAIDAVGQMGREQREDDLLKEMTLNDFLKHPEEIHHAAEHVPDSTLWKEHEYNNYKWGMAIDINKCTGCSACVVACQAENNIPVVGKEEVNNGREMHWIRVDRYYKGEPANPGIAHQPVNCPQCENAPCEQVCPVAATVHSSEGLNSMVYNRCVGTRYCSNNCPFKVRRFNWFYFHDTLSQTEKMQFNPEVTVRSRGVMEKCTYCVQRIENAKIQAKNEGRQVRDGEIVPACAQVCPTRAISFGDLNNQLSTVAKHHNDHRAYH
ncbi:4Fe-4S dicluster domain-containing protein, partial [bacterium]|nr:4Fe-4S dicluster domain-containing protein [bacterium]